MLRKVASRSAVPYAGIRPRAVERAFFGGADSGREKRPPGESGHQFPAVLKDAIGHIIDDMKVGKQSPKQARLKKGDG